MCFNEKKNNGVVVLLTDFGGRGWYPAVMKGAILSINPVAEIVDLCHDITGGDIREAGFVLGASFSYFPRGTVFVCVVDPGVGGERSNLILQTEDYLFVAPDNGILTPVFSKARSKAVFSVERGRYTGERRGVTFLGRDIFAPIAANLSLGIRPSEMGKAVESILTLPEEEISLNKGRISGSAFYVDTFGNIITNISMEYLAGLFEGSIPREDCVVSIAGREIPGIKEYYAEGITGELIAVENSWGYLEIAVNGGNAFKRLGYKDKESIEVYLSSDRLKDRGVE